MSRSVCLMRLVRNNKEKPAAQLDKQAELAKKKGARFAGCPLSFPKTN